jgi:hypothetical protein
MDQHKLDEFHTKLNAALQGVQLTPEQRAKIEEVFNQARVEHQEHTVGTTQPGQPHHPGQQQGQRQQGSETQAPGD